MNSCNSLAVSRDCERGACCAGHGVGTAVLGRYQQPAGSVVETSCSARCLRTLLVQPAAEETHIKLIKTNKQKKTLKQTTRTP